MRALHRLQLGAQRVLLSQAGGSRLAWLAPSLFFGVPLPPLDRAFSFRMR